MTLPEAGPLSPSRPAVHEELTALARRIAAAITDAEMAAPESQPRALVFRLGDLRLAFPLTAVREVVVPPESMSRVPRTTEGVLGIMNLRGRVVAVFDLVHALPGSLASRLNDPAARPVDVRIAERRILLLDRGRHEIGLLVHGIEGIEPLPGSGPGEPVLLQPDEIARAIELLVA